MNTRFRIRMAISSVAVVLYLSSAISFAQTSSDPDIKSRVEAIRRGDAESVRKELPLLRASYVNNPGVMYLEALLTEDGSDAARIYQGIVDGFPDSEWADDALYRLYQYYYSIGLYKTADQKLAQLRDRYPHSQYASPSSEPRPEERRQAVVTPPAAAFQAPAETRPAPTVRPSPAEPRESAKPFTVQVGAFGDIRNAKDLSERVRRKGYSVEVVSGGNPSSPIHRVWVGSYADRASAQRAAAEIRASLNIESIVTTR